MSGLLALLDDVAAIAKVAATSVDDIAAAAGKAGTKTAGVLIDDAAVTPRYLQGFAPARELPVVWRIARGSVFNKLVILLPVAMLLAAFAPWMLTPLLMLGGCYLCFEGAEKIFHALFPHGDARVEADMSVRDPGHLEEEKVRGAIKTDFILSAEIMTIALSAIEAPNIWMQAATLAVVGLMVTVAVYGAVGLIVKMDDVGLYMARNAFTALGRGLGRALVKFMPVLLKLLTIIGTAAMLWVGGSIILHGLDQMGWPVLYDAIHHLADNIARDAGEWKDTAEWVATAALDGLLGLFLGLILVPMGTKMIAPVWAKVSQLNPFTRVN